MTLFHGLPRSLSAFFLLALVHLALAMPLRAQPGPESKGVLDGARAELTQIEAALTRDALDDARLNELRARLEPIVGQIETIIAREHPRLDDIKARIEKLGPAPDAAKGASESDGVATERADQQRQLKEADEGLKIAQALALRAGQLKDAISERRRENFSRAILVQSTSLISPLLWLGVIQALPVELRAARMLVSQWGETVANNLSWIEGLVLFGLILVAVAGWPKLKDWVRQGAFGAAASPTEAGQKEGTQTEVPRLTRALIGLRLVLLNALVPAGIFYLLHWLLESFGLLPVRTAAIMDAVTAGLTFVAAVSGLAAGLLAPNRPAVRLLAVPDTMAREAFRLVRVLAALIALGRVAEALESAIVSALPVVVATKGVFAVLVALVLAGGLKRIFSHDPQKVDPVQSAASAALLPVRLFGWAAVVGILGAVLTGYVSLAGFLVNQLAWLTILGLVMLLALVLIEEFLGEGLSSKGGFGRRVRDATGLTANSLDQIAVLGSGFARLMLYLALGMLALAPWGIDSSNLMGNLKAAFFGFSVGGVTISLSSIAMAVVFFALGLAATRAVQNWLDTRYLPHTGLDVGLRNSIRTIFGYIGTIVAMMVALSQIGLSMEKLTLVAGALSVGIGFGLKSIVENFVSGLILLWERPIRVGDWVVVGTEQGKVKRINVRSTEIETFDRASLIIPNAEFISGRVKNWTHADHMARIIIPITVDPTCDPEQVATLLKDSALAHREVLSEPGPSVIFKNLGENGLEFELRAYVDVDSLGLTRSELLFDIFRRLREAKIEVPTPTRRLEITNLASMVEQGAFVPSPRQPGEA